MSFQGLLLFWILGSRDSVNRPCSSRFLLILTAFKTLDLNRKVQNSQVSFLCRYCHLNDSEITHGVFCHFVVLCVLACSIIPQSCMERNKRQKSNLNMLKFMLNSVNTSNASFIFLWLSLISLPFTYYHVYFFITEKRQQKQFYIIKTCTNRLYKMI